MKGPSKYFVRSLIRLRVLLTQSMNLRLLQQNYQNRAKNYCKYWKCRPIIVNFTKYQCHFYFVAKKRKTFKNRGQGQDFFFFGLPQQHSVFFSATVIGHPL